MQDELTIAQYGEAYRWCRNNWTW